MTTSDTSNRRRLSDEDLQSIKNANPILDVVEQHVTLRRVGGRYLGLCPFHDERTPSFNVNPATGTYKCFGCDMSGDVISFVQEIEGGAGFRFAAETLAARAGITIVGSDDPDADKAARELRSRILEANQAASEFYTDLLLNHPEATTARNELTKRNYTAEHATHFGCGYSPTGGTALAQHLTARGYAAPELIAAGLVRERKGGNGIYDRFRGRLMWTIRSEMDRAIGFGARRIYDDDKVEAKFLNTEETPVYKKSEVLYGYHLARKSILTRKHAIVVEGYADVMACHAAGETNAVATCGTSFTREHLRILRRAVGEAGEITFAFDNDKAGQKAALTVYDLTHTTVRRLTALPIGADRSKDPDKTRTDSGDQAVRDLITRRIPLVINVIDVTLNGMPLLTPEDKTVAIDQIVPLLNRVSDPLVRSEYAAHVARRVQVKTADVTSRLANNTPTGTAQLDTATLSGPTHRLNLENEALSALMQNEKAACQFAEFLAGLTGDDTQELILDGIMAATDTPYPPGTSWFDHVLTCIPDMIRPTVFDLAATPPPVPPERVPAYVHDLIDRIRETREETKLRELASRVNESDDPSDALNALIAQAQGKTP